MFNNISIIGCGLIGSSILEAINKKNIAKKVFVYDKSKDVLSFLKKNNPNNNITNDIKFAVKDADLIIIAAPLSAYKEILLSIKDNIKANSILTDTGSAKKEINKTANAFDLSEFGSFKN